MIHVMLRDYSQAMVEALKQAATLYHGDLVTIDVETGDALDGTADAIVSPANSFGFMDGGFDLALSHHFGWELQDRVQARIKARTQFAELLVGDALCVPTEDASIPNLIVAPTMRVPSLIVDPNAVFLATRAAVRCAADHGLASLIMTGMGTGVGRLVPEIAAKEMIAGINEAVRPSRFPVSWSDARERQFARQELP